MNKIISLEERLIDKTVDDIVCMFEKKDSMLRKRLTKYFTVFTSYYWDIDRYELFYDDMINFFKKRIYSSPHNPSVEKIIDDILIEEDVFKQNINAKTKIYVKGETRWKKK